MHKKIGDQDHKKSLKERLEFLAKLDEINDLDKDKGSSLLGTKGVGFNNNNNNNMYNMNNMNKKDK